MEHNDLGPGRNISRRCGVLFETLVATPPPSRSFAQRPRVWGRSRPETLLPPLSEWSLDEIVYRSLRHLESRQIATEVYTFISGEKEWIDSIDNYLNMLGVYPWHTAHFNGPEMLGAYVRANLEVHTVFVPTPEMAAAVGMRATVALPGKQLVF